MPEGQVRKSKVGRLSLSSAQLKKTEIHGKPTMLPHRFRQPPYPKVLGVLLRQPGNLLFSFADSKCGRPAEFLLNIFWVCNRQLHSAYISPKLAYCSCPSHTGKGSTDRNLSSRTNCVGTSNVALMRLLNSQFKTSSTLHFSDIRSIFQMLKYATHSPVFRKRVRLAIRR